jgi:RNA recognition motif-containing protein
MSFKLLVGNLPAEAEEENLREFFSTSGAVKAVIVPLNEHGRHRGYAHVEMCSRQEAVQAQSDLANKEFLGRKLSVTLKDEDVAKAPGMFAWFKPKKA